MRNSNADEEDPRGSKHGQHFKLACKIKVFKINLQVSTMKNRDNQLNLKLSSLYSVVIFAEM